ncbi:MAG: polysaccharide deacetylase family protein [Paenalcaligenes sp.]
MNQHDVVRDFIGYGATPPQAQWPGGARLAINFCLNFEEGAELSVLDGDAITESALTEGGAGVAGQRDLAAESMFEYGSRVGFWRLDRLLAERDMPATVMACAQALARHPDACARINERNYDICAHGLRWEHHQGLPIDEERSRIQQALALIQQSLGRPAEGWYCRYGPSPNTRRLVVEQEGLLYDSDAYNDDLPYWVKVQQSPHLVVPYSLVNNDTKFMRGALASGSDFYTALRDAFDFLYEESAHTPRMMSVGLHLRVAGHAGRAAGLARFLDHIATKQDVWVCRRADLARHWMAVHPPS